ncbi:hypothetical protein LX32DRAFT_2646 [Colletotrichum zoysiae]|uniref:Uncharacterized protein n=1 Tax=Colletotrichum zoysiae TaxID=1216348 RepID=A0AAD9M834_9PEZI|nr:hypothetical protein LX32DRAFT_2646 [Colletotrichum zoysiae]
MPAIPWLSMVCFVAGPHRRGTKGELAGLGEIQLQFVKSRSFVDRPTVEAVRENACYGLRRPRGTRPCSPLFGTAVWKACRILLTVVTCHADCRIRPRSLESYEASWQKGCNVMTS